MKEQEKRDWFRNNAYQYTGNTQLRREHEKIFDDQISNYNDEISVLRKNTHRFIKQKTENIMDYDLNNQKTFDKWQWKVIQEETKTYYHE